SPASSGQEGSAAGGDRAEAASPAGGPEAATAGGDRAAAAPPAGGGQEGPPPGSAGESPGRSRSARGRVLAGIRCGAGRDPAHRGALTGLKELRGFDGELGALSGMWGERGRRLQGVGGATRAEPRQYARGYRIYTEAASTRHVAEPPE